MFKLLGKRGGALAIWRSQVVRCNLLPLKWQSWGTHVYAQSLSNQMDTPAMSPNFTSSISLTLLLGGGVCSVPHLDTPTLTRCISSHFQVWLHPHLPPILTYCISCINLFTPRLLTPWVTLSSVHTSEHTSHWHRLWATEWKVEWWSEWWLREYQAPFSFTWNLGLSFPLFFLIFFPHLTSL